MPDESAFQDVVHLVSGFLEDQSPLASVASWARCSGHFWSYLLYEQACFRGRCFDCEEDLSCAVVSHEHAAPYIVYVDELGDGYAWDVREHGILCLRCALYQGLRTAPLLHAPGGEEAPSRPVAEQAFILDACSEPLLKNAESRCSGDLLLSSPEDGVCRAAQGSSCCSCAAEDAAASTTPCSR